MTSFFAWHPSLVQRDNILSIIFSHNMNCSSTSVNQDCFTTKFTVKEFHSQSGVSQVFSIIGNCTWANLWLDITGVQGFANIITLFWAPHCFNLVYNCHCLILMLNRPLFCSVPISFRKHIMATISSPYSFGSLHIAFDCRWICFGFKKKQFLDWDQVCRARIVCNGWLCIWSNLDAKKN